MEKDVDSAATLRAAPPSPPTSTRDTDSNASVNYTLVHDAAGQLTDDNQSYKYVWDAFGRLVTVKNQSNATVAEYGYNGLGYRISWHYDADVDNDVDGSDPTYYFCYDDRWRVVATLRGSDSKLKELFYYHNAGANGLGGSSYIDLAVLRDKDTTNAWTASGSGTLAERSYLCQNWRADVSVLVTTGGVPVEWVKYSSPGARTRRHRRMMATVTKATKLLANLSLRGPKRRFPSATPRPAPPVPSAGTTGRSSLRRPSTEASTLRYGDRLFDDATAQATPLLRVTGLPAGSQNVAWPGSSCN